MATAGQIPYRGGMPQHSPDNQIANDNGEAALEFYDQRRKWADYISAHPSVSDRAFRVGWWLSRKMNGNDQRCWYSVPTIAKRMKKSERYVRYALRELQDANVLLVIPEKGKPNSYHLHAPFL
jgi:AraC-like DNA-binding protein